MRDFPNSREFALLPILEDSTDGIALVELESWLIVWVNPTLTSWIGRTPEEFAGHALAELLPGCANAVGQSIDDLESRCDTRTTRIDELLLANGSTRQVVIRTQKIDTSGGPMIAIVVRDAALAALQATIHVVGQDPLTGLADRSVLLARMVSLLRGERAADRQFAVLFIDLDDFKQVNDAYGHLVGDRVLDAVAQRLAGCVRTGDLIVRYGGDEFVALVENVAGLAEIQPVVDRIDAALAEPIQLPEGEMTLSASVGICEASVEHRTPEDLLRDADRAMYASKRLPR